MTTLSDACEDSLGWVYPPPAPAPSGVSYVYHPEVVSLRGPAQIALNALATVSLLGGSVVKIVIDPGTGYENQEYILRSGTADAGDPGEVAPLDFSTTNQKFWARIT